MKIKDLDLEQEILGILLNGKKLDEGILKLDASCFNTLEHQMIFNMIADYHMNDIEITMNIMFSAMASIPDVRTEYVVTLYNSFASDKNFNMLCSKLVEYRKNKKVKEQLRNTVDLFKNEEDIDAVIKSVEKILDVDADNSIEDTGMISEGINNFLRELEERAENGGGIQGIERGIASLDEYTNGMQHTCLDIIAGRPGSGKTTVVLNELLNASNRGKNIVFFNLEMEKEKLIEKCVSKLGTVDSSKLKFGQLSDEEWDWVAQATEQLQSNSKHFRIFDNLYDFNAIVNKIRFIAKKLEKEGQKLDIIAIDYLQLMTSRDNFQSKNYEISHYTRELKKLAKDLKINIRLLSQLNRGVEARADKRPMMSDLRDSGGIEADADNIFFCYRDEYYNPDSEDRGLLEYIVSKQRNGRTGTIKLAWIPEYSTVADLNITKTFKK